MLRTEVPPVLRTLRIQGFRGFETFETELQTVNVLLGPNSCGKSTALHAIRLACSALTWTLQQQPEPKLDGDWIVIWWDWPVDHDETFLPPMHTEELFRNRGDKPVVITLRFDDTDFIQELRVSLRYGRSDALRLDVRVKSQETMAAVAGLKPKSKHLTPTLARSLTDKEPTAITIPAFYGVVQDEPFVNDARLARELSAGEQGRVVRNLIGRLSNTKELNDFLTLSVGAEITKSTSGQQLQMVEELTAHYRDSNGELELSSAGTGLVALAALYSAFAWYAPRAAKGRPLIFLLDEPEAHLHPKLQGQTGERIAQLVGQFGAQALIATHSVEMINRLGFRPETLLLSVDRTSPQPVVRLTTENEVVERLESFCDLSPFTSLNLLRSRKVLFHEGRTDRLILEVCARVRFANDAPRLQRFSQWTFVELSSVTNADAKDLLKKALEPLGSLAKGEQVVRIVRVLDRDQHRVPVVGPEQGDGGVKEFDVVWSGYSIESLFLDPSCLAAWLWYELRNHSGAPSLQEIERAVADGIAAANADVQLIKQATDQVFTRLLRTLTVGQLDSDKRIIQLGRDAEQRVKAEPHVYQQGKDRAKRILEHVRSTLPVALRNRIRSDIPDILRYAPSPSTLVAPALVPPEIAKLLEYMSAP
jgi:energy-coupling factor transporter ATP-binding protein EcfA2